MDLKEVNLPYTRVIAKTEALKLAKIDFSGIETTFLDHQEYIYKIYVS